jgi:GT2 family glycosyltransferase
VPTLAVVIPTTHWVSEVTSLCEQVRLSSPVSTRIVVVDNGPQASAEDWPNGLEVVVDQSYLGSGGAFSRGAVIALESRPDWTLLLDHDAEVARDTIGSMLAVAESDPTGVYVARAHGTVWASSSWRGPVYRVPESEGSLVPLDFAQWSGFLLPTPALEALSDFKSDYFFGWDDYRFSAYLRAEGFSLSGVPSVVVLNRRRPGQWESSWRRYYGARNRILLSSDLYGRWSWAAMRAISIELVGMRHEPRARARGIKDALTGRRGEVVSPGSPGV